MTTAPIDLLLEKARISPRPYTDAELTRAEDRLTARINRRVWQGALSFDDRVAAARTAAAPPRGTGRDPLPRRSWHQQLRTLCETVVARDLHKLRTFFTGRVLEPDGARVLGSVLYLAGREESARFWWQFAAGAEDLAAACCLYLHHMAYAERDEAEVWREQALSGTERPQPAERGRCRDLTKVLRVLELLREGRPRFTPAVSAVMAYVPLAVEFVDDLELPLPDVDFSLRIGQLTGATAS